MPCTPTFLRHIVLAALLALVPTLECRADSESCSVIQRLDAWASRNAPSERYGFFTVDQDARLAPLDDLDRRTRRAVVLVHGLDDPGWMWRDVAGPLEDAGHTVLRFEYPNDQAIARSTEFLAHQLVRLRERGIREVSFVAHSMGSLVLRDLITRSDLEGWHPDIKHIIMIAPPNDGALLAHLRGISEVREHIVRIFRGEGMLLGASADGDGRAGHDLVPGSAFLDDLNDRDLPDDVGITIVAGRIAPLLGDDLHSWARALLDWAESVDMPRWIRNIIRKLAYGRPGKSLNRAADALGDGVVSVNSTKLDGVRDHVVVDADHMSILSDWLPGERTPPAVPIVLDRLGRAVGR